MTWFAALKEAHEGYGWRNVQSVGVVFYLQRDCWQWFTADKYKGSVRLYAGPIALEIEV